MLLTMTMDGVSTKHLCMILIVTFFSVTNGKAVGHVVPQASQLLLKTNGSIAEVYSSGGNGGSWLQALLLFAPQDQTGGCPNTTALSQEVITSRATMRCPNEFVTLGEHCYYFSPNTAKWHDALQLCQSLGSLLAHPLTSMENALLVNRLRNHYKGSGDWYLGGNDEAVEGEWVWAHSKSRIVFADWAKEQPNNHENKQHCLNYVEANDWKWNDYPCTNFNRYICQL